MDDDSDRFYELMGRRMEATEAGEQHTGLSSDAMVRWAFGRGNPRNDAFLHDYLPGAVAAWGAHKLAAARALGVVHAFAGRPLLWCLGVTKDGHPRHPLYVRADAPLILWRTT